VQRSRGRGGYPPHRQPAWAGRAQRVGGRAAAPGRRSGSRAAAPGRAAARAKWCRAVWPRAPKY